MKIIIIYDDNNIDTSGGIAFFMYNSKLRVPLSKIKTNGAIGELNLLENEVRYQPRMLSIRPPPQKKKLCMEMYLANRVGKLLYSK